MFTDTKVVAETDVDKEWATYFFAWAVSLLVLTGEHEMAEALCAPGALCGES